MTVYGYVRVSTLEQVDNSSMMEQRRVINGLAMTHGLDVQTFVKDGGVSGSIPFLERLRAKNVELAPGDVVIVAKLDRYSRDLEDALASMRWCKENGVRLIINGHGDVTDEANLVSRLMFEIMGAFAGHERRVIRQRMGEGREAKKASGGHIGGSAPFGYRVVGEGRDARLEKDEKQQEILVVCRSWRAAGMSFRSMSAKVLEEYGVRVSYEALRRIFNQGEAK
jgi:DNA invertase Pin-like site-specific DNA recombinase